MSAPTPPPPNSGRGDSTTPAQPPAPAPNTGTSTDADPQAVNASGARPGPAREPGAAAPQQPPTAARPTAPSGGPGRPPATTAGPTAPRRPATPPAGAPAPNRPGPRAPQPGQPAPQTRPSPSGQPFAPAPHAGRRPGPTSGGLTANPVTSGGSLGAPGRPQPSAPAGRTLGGDDDAPAPKSPSGLRKLADGLRGKPSPAANQASTGAGAAGASAANAAGKAGAQAAAGKAGGAAKDKALDAAKNKAADEVDPTAGVRKAKQAASKAADEGKGRIGQAAAAAQEAGTEAASTYLQTVGVPKFISKPLLNGVLKYGVKATAIMLSFVLFILAGSTIAFVSSVGGVPNIGADPIRKDIAATIPKQYLDAYYSAASETGVPWTVLAAIGQVASDHGRTSPYDAEDYGQAYDRDPERPSLIPAGKTLAGGDVYTGASQQVDTEAAAKLIQGMVGKTATSSTVAWIGTAYSSYGVSLPDDLAGMSRAGQAINRYDLRKGDLLVWSDAQGAPVGVGVYIGGDQFVIAPGPDQPIIQAALPYRTDLDLTFRRVLPSLMPAANANASVLFYGDSLTEGMKASIPATLSGAKVTIDSSSGRTTGQAADALAAMAKAGSLPQVVVLGLGSNDALADFTANGDRLLAALQGHTVIWANLFSTVGGDPAPYNQWLAGKAAGDDGIIVADVASAATGVTAPDGIHLTDEGYKKRSAVLTDKVRQALQSGSTPAAPAATPAGSGAGAGTGAGTPVANAAPAAAAPDVAALAAQCPKSAPDNTVRAGATLDICAKSITTARSKEAAGAILFAFQHLGDPYSQSNREAAHVFDCSALVGRAYRDGGGVANYFDTFGYTGAYATANPMITPIDRSQAKPGDVVILYKGSIADSAGNAGHAQMVLADGYIIQSGGGSDSRVNVDSFPSWPGWQYTIFAVSANGSPVITTGGGGGGAAVPATYVKAVHPDGGTSYSCDRAAYGPSPATEGCGPYPIMGFRGGEAKGPFLIRENALLDTDVNPQDVKASIMFIAKDMAKVRGDLLAGVDADQYSGWQNNTKAADKLWSDVLAHMGGVLSDPSKAAAACSPPTNKGTAETVASIFSCKLGLAPTLSVVSSVSTAGGTPAFTTYNQADAVNQLTGEALDVSYAWSQWGTKPCDNTAEYAGVFPLTKEQMAASGITDRCDTVANVTAAADLIITAETADPSRRFTIGTDIDWTNPDAAAAASAGGTITPWERMAGGWRLLSGSGVLGAGYDTFRTSGAAAPPKQPPAACTDALGTWVTSVAADPTHRFTSSTSPEERAALDKEWDALSGNPPTSPDCATATGMLASDWYAATARAAYTQAKSSSLSGANGLGAEEVRASLLRTAGYLQTRASLLGAAPDATLSRLSPTGTATPRPSVRVPDVNGPAMPSAKDIMMRAIYLGGDIHGDDRYKDMRLVDASCAAAAPAGTSGGGSAGSISSTGQEKDNAKIIYTQLVKAGATPEGAAGVLGNLVQESHFDPNIIEGQNAFAQKNPRPEIKYRGFGLAQWTSTDRQANLLAYADATGRQWDDLGMQVDFIVKEMQEGYPSAWRAVTTATDVSKAAYDVHRIYEGSADSEAAIQSGRVVPATAFLTEFRGTPAATAPTPGGTPAVVPVANVVPASCAATPAAGTPASGAADGKFVPGGLPFPVEGITTTSSGFGWRANPTGSGTQLHSGLDFPGGAGGQAIKAVAGGTATVMPDGTSGGYGNLVKIDHGNGWETWYAHQSKINVANGAQVKAGDVIGYVGSTGNSTGPHLHLEIHHNGEAVDPAPFIAGLSGG